MRLLAVNHHYVRDAAPDRGIHPVSYATLRERLIAALAWYRPIRQSELVAVLAGEQRLSDMLVVTFDDGLREQASAARRLASEGIPSICFVPTLPLVTHRLLDVHRVHLLRVAASDAELAQDLATRFGPAFAAIDIDSARAQYRYDSDDARRVKFFLNFVLDPDERERWTAMQFERRLGQEDAAAEALYMDADEVRSLARDDMVATHGHAHRPLATLPPEEQRADIAQSISVLRRICGRHPVGIAYPYGGPDAVDETTASLAAELGLCFGFTMRRGIDELDASLASLKLSRNDTNDLPALLKQHEAAR